MFLFEPQTGRRSRSFISSSSAEANDWPSNFYHFLLDDRHGAWVSGLVENAVLDSGGLTYPMKEIELLHNRDLWPAVKRGRLVWDG